MPRVAKVCVIADTHVHQISELPASLIQVLKDADLIIHLGDFVDSQLLDELASLSDFRAVAGNHDGKRIKGLLPRRDLIEINGKKLGLIHGSGCRRLRGMERGLCSRFRGEKPHAILYGHTHVIENQTMNGTLFFNPGSVLRRFPALEPSYGMLVVGETITAQIRYFTPQAAFTTGNFLGNVIRNASALQIPRLSSALS